MPTYHVNDVSLLRQRPYLHARFFFLAVHVHVHVHVSPCGKPEAAITSPLFLLIAIFSKMLSKNTTRCFEKISMCQKVRLIAW
jgi:hypothetical protein